MQTSYDTKLLDATHDAMQAFELNTANEDLSSVADSLRTIIDASSNIFINTLATNMGLSNASKSYIQPYIPGILYTLYDGYYINSPTHKPEMAVTNTGVVVEIDEGTDSAGNATGKFATPGLKYESEHIYTFDSNSERNFNIPTTVPVEDFGELLYKRNDGTYTTDINDNQIVYSTQYVLKSYMPYSARYLRDDSIDSKDIDVTINYTLDNYLTIVGNVGNAYYTKSGYLIENDLVKSIRVNKNDGSYIQLVGETYTYNENQAEEMIKSETTVNVEVKLDDNGTERIFVTDGDINSDKTNAAIYYAKAKIFSDWVYANLGTLQEQNIIENTSNSIIGTTEKGTEDVIYTFEGKTSLIFNPNEDPEKNSSTFTSHKFQVIRNSIQYNLNLAMSIYNNQTVSSYDFSMPIISETEWEKIINNISIVTFMQGLNCGLKTYNNYAIVSSTNNEITVPIEEIYYIEKDLFNNGMSTYHRIDCPEFNAEDKEIISFMSKEVKYDKLYDKTTSKYNYDHKNLACYTCIVDGNYTSADLTASEKLAKLIAIGKQRNTLYKMNAIKYSEGYEMIYESQSKVAELKTGTKKTTRELKDIQKIEVTFGNIDCTDVSEAVVRFKIPYFNDDVYVLNTNQSKEQTIVIDVKENSETKIDLTNITNNIYNQNDLSAVSNNTIKKAIKSVKVIYK